MKSLMLLLHNVLHDMESLCCVSTDLDIKTIEIRVKHEGLSFLTITLPDFAKDFERSLELGKVDHLLFRSFAFQKGLPRFLGGFLDRVFDRSNGCILDEPDIDCIFAIRQITLLFSKIKLPCRDDRVAKAFSGYIECELDVIRSSSNMYTGVSFSEEDFVRMSSLLFRTLFSRMANRLYSGEFLPKHSGGSTAERTLGNKKYRQQEWSSRLDDEFPFMEHLATSHSLSFDRLSSVDVREPWNERPVRVIQVPKTLKTPRIIAIEPSYMQFMQQAILELFTEELNRDYILKPLLNGSDQEPNRTLARLGSLNGDLATLDLSEASDRVSNQHVRLMTRRWPTLDRAVQACRSRKADVPGFGVISLAKFASMGSALCFPFEAAVFLTAIFLGIEKELMQPMTRKLIKSFHGKVRVFGDDIIVPKEYTRSVVDSLESFGFKVNQRKSFWNGKFRESCGKEYYNGHDVSITRVRRLLPKQRKHVEEMESTVAFRNLAYKSGLWSTVRFLDDYIERLIPFPAVEETSPGLGKFSYLGFSQDKLDSDLQVPLVKGAFVRRKIPVDRLDDYGALLKFFLKRGVDPHVDRNHLERAGRPDFANIKIGWIRSY